jgi:pilus assembly protein FimV
MSPAAAHAKPNVDFDLEGKGGASSAPAPDFDLDVEPTRKVDDFNEPTSSSGSSALDFDIAPTAPTAAPLEPVKEEKPSFDFDLSGLEFPGSSKPAASTDLEVDPTQRGSGAGSTSPSLDLADLSLDGDSGGGGGEAVGTKLELAKAYLEIGDKDGAREILQEVAKEGSSAQKEEAQKLIASL